jgi:bis(5'-nucleosyl)-tetraphosphatase (symmetrical)
MALLDLIQFDPLKDQLWFAGDLVNRGKNSLDVLRFVKNLGAKQITVLGNHDFHLLAVGNDCQSLRPEDTVQDILNALDRDELLNWLRYQKLLYHDTQLNFILVHAGISPEWDLDTAKACAQEVEDILKSDQYVELLPHLYGDTPVAWHENLQGWKRYRFIVNVFARMRYCDENGHLDLQEKGPLGQQAEDLYPWFNAPMRKPIQQNIIFGHWAALNGITNTPKIFTVDTGCAWGHRLTAMRLEDQKRFSISVKR